ncbi:MAG TPA: hypothetical protein PLJ60_00565 [Chryseolinea sp.]|nr:hypothetical protein [Chryseolinea sp.]HPM28799.1 hypothetical protein [Chryseolinea sp.]
MIRFFALPSTTTIRTKNEVAEFNSIPKTSTRVSQTQNQFTEDFIEDLFF